MANSLPALNLPPFPHQVTQQASRTLIFDSFRKKHVTLTPEEWVRQHFVHYLTGHLHYPRAWIKLEGSLKVNGLNRRADIVVFGRDTQPFLVVECKSYDVKLGPTTFHQSSMYNYTLQSPYLVITNGLQHYCCRIDHQRRTFEFQSQLPKYK